MIPMQAEYDLKWYFTQSDKELGCSSSWGPLCDLAQSGISFGGGVKTSDPYTERQIQAVERERRVREALRSLPIEYQRNLWLIYDAEWRRPWIRMDKFGKLGVLALHTVAAKEAYHRARASNRHAGRSLAEWLDVAAGKSEGLFAAVYREANALACEALRAFENAAYRGRDAN